MASVAPANWSWNKDGEFFFADSFGDVSGQLDFLAWPRAVRVDKLTGDLSETRVIALVQLLKLKYPEHAIYFWLSAPMRQLLESLAPTSQLYWSNRSEKDAREARLELMA